MYRASVALTALVCGLPFVTAASAQDTSAALQQLRLTLGQARQLLTAGSTSEAEALYRSVLAATSNSSLRAEGHLGRGVAAYSRLLRADSASRAALGDSILRDYSAAEEFSVGNRVAARNNMALVMRTLGRHRDALELFNAATGASAPGARAPFLVNAGREYETLGDPRNAAQRYEEAIRDDSTSVDAMASLLSVLGARFLPRDFLVAAKRWRRNETHARAVIEATADILFRESTSNEEAAQALVYLASALPAAHFGPSAFDGTVRERLRRGAVTRPAIGSGVEALIHAYERRRREDTYREPPSAQWWRFAPDSGRAAWSSVLRSLGDWYDQQGAQMLARSYYERAIGLGTANFNEEWIDRRALKPLGLIYAQTDEAQGENLQRAIDRYSEMLFAAKGAAYAKGDIEQVRDFHMTLGAIYAERGQWTGAGARNAEFQIENMRRASAELARVTGREVEDPPELLEKLALRYDTTNRQAQAADLKAQLRRDYARKGRADLGDSAARRIETRTVKPPVSEAARSSAVRGAEAAAVPQRDASPPARAVEIRPTPVVGGAAGRGAAPTTLAAESVVITLANAITGRALANTAITLVVNGVERRSQSDAQGKVTVTVPRGAAELRLSVTIAGYATLTNTYKVEPNLAIRLRPR